MSNEITLSVRFDVSNGNYAPGSINLSNLQFTQATAGADERIQNIGTTEETLGETLTTTGWLFMRNLDAANYVEWGPATNTYIGRIEAGEFAVFRTVPAAVVYVKANTAACDVWYRWLED
jgi:hypothetical protein